jgi:hypothetical protein
MSNNKKGHKFGGGDGCPEILRTEGSNNKLRSVKKE